MQSDKFLITNKNYFSLQGNQPKVPNLRDGAEKAAEAKAPVPKEERRVVLRGLIAYRHLEVMQ